MSDADGRPAFRQFFQRRLHNFFGLGIQRIGCFIQDQDRGVAQNRARDRNALALTTGNVDSFFTDNGFVPAGFLEDEPVGIGVPGGFFDFRIGGFGPAQADVAPDGVVKENCFLGHHRDVGPKVTRRNGTDIRITHENGAGGGVIKARAAGWQSMFCRSLSVPTSATIWPG